MAKAKKKSPPKKTTIKKVASKVKAKIKSKITAAKTKVVAKSKAVAKSSSKASPKSAAKAAPTKSMTMAPTKPQKSADFKNFLTPLDDRILVRISEMERKTAGGLFIPDTVADVSGNLEGLIVAAGRGHRDKKGRVRPLDVQVGDCVIFSQYSGNKIEMQGENVILLREADVMGIVNK